MTGLRLAFSWLTVLPIRGPDTVDRTLAKKAIAFTPVVGLVLGGVAAGLLWLLEHRIEPSLAGLLTVAALILATRGMHLDGLADTFDGLGCYGPPERAREVMRSGSAGPFGVAAIVVSIGVQSLSLGFLGFSEEWAAIVIAVCTGRVAVVLACRQGIRASSDTGFGALVAGTQPLWIGLVWSAALVVAAAFALDCWWLLPLAVVVVLALSMLFVAHCAKRFGGVSGDVLGAVIEVTVASCAVGALL